MSCQNLFFVDKKIIADMLSHTRDLVAKYHPRLPGSPGCLLVARDLKAEFEKNCDSTSLETFTLHPSAFFNLGRIIAANYLLISILLFFAGPAIYISTFLFSLVNLYFLVEFVFFGNLFDPLFRKYPGTNAVGIMEPSKDAKQQIIICSHHDSTHICGFLEKYPSLYSFRILMAMLFGSLAYFGLVIISLFQVVGAPPLFPLSAFRLFLALGLPFFIPLFIFYTKETSPGVGDNLLSSVLLSRLAKLFNHEGLDLDLLYTRLIFLSCDGEEIGQKGAREYVRRHKKEMLMIPTFVLNIDNINKYEDLAMLRSDTNGIRRLSDSMAENCRQIAAALGYQVKKIRFPFGGGGTDAAPFAKAGIEAASLIGISTSFNRSEVVYHTSRDTVDSVEEKALEACCNIVINYILHKDQKLKEMPFALKHNQTL